MDIILVVNDETRNLILVTTQLLLANYQVATAAVQKDAVELARMLKPRLIVMDLILADGDGWSAMRELREEADLSHIPVIVVSARSEPADIDEAFKAGANDYLQKPYSVQDLRDVLNRHLVGATPQ